jgi:hypothetical protein
MKLCLCSNGLAEKDSGSCSQDTRKISVLLEYARAVNVYVDALIDDRVDLPPQLPSLQKHEGIARAFSGKRRKS